MVSGALAGGAGRAAADASAVSPSPKIAMAAAKPLAPGRVRRGFRNIRRDLGTPARVAKLSRPGPGRPKGSSKGPAPRHLLPGEAGTPRTANTTLTREKVKT